MGGYLKILLLVALTLAVAVSGCAVPGESPPESSPHVYLSISPSPTAVPGPIATPLPSPLVTLAPPAPSHDTLIAPAGTNYSRTYAWEYRNVDWAFTAIVQKEKYDQFRAKPHSPDISFASYALASADRDLLRSAVSQFRQGGAGYGYTRYDDAMNVITFVQSISYVDDHPAGSPRYPLETLVDGQGDCKDKAVLAAALLHEMGYDAVLLKFPGHVAVGVNIEADGASYTYNGSLYHYIETSGTGWKIGDVPDELKGVGPAIIPLVKNPELEVTVTASPADETGGVVYYRAQYSVRNAGPGTAKHLVLKVRALALSHGENVIWAPERTVELGDLAEGQTMRSDVLMNIPAGEPSRIVCIVSGENADRAQASTADFVAGI